MSDNTQQATDNRTDRRTTEQKTASARKIMRFYKPYQTIGRGHGRIDGWYYTEPKTIYGECTA